VNKMAKTAIVCTVLFVVSLLASAAFFIAARPEYPKHMEKFNEYVESWEICVPDFIDMDGFSAVITDQQYHVYVDDNGVIIREITGEEDVAQSSALEGEEAGNTVSSEAAAE